ncbi:hypothetical protein A6R68_21653, partial [Neotoma lepida]
MLSPVALQLWKHCVPAAHLCSLLKETLEFPTTQFLYGLLYVGPRDGVSIQEADLQHLAFSKIHAHPPPTPTSSLVPVPNAYKNSQYQITQLLKQREERREKEEEEGRREEEEEDKDEDEAAAAASDGMPRKCYHSKTGRDFITQHVMGITANKLEDKIFAKRTKVHIEHMENLKNQDSILQRGVMKTSGNVLMRVKSRQDQCSTLT